MGHTHGAQRVKERAYRADERCEAASGLGAGEAHERARLPNAEQQNGYEADHRIEVHGIQRVEGVGLPACKPGDDVVHEQA